MNRIIFFLLAFPIFSNAQNVGVGTDDPTEKLEVNGIIFTSQGGIKFPDGTIQTTAYQPGTSMMQSNLSGLVVEFSPDAMITGPAMDALIQDGINVLSVSDGLTAISGSNPSFFDLSFVREANENSANIFSNVTTGNTIDHVEVFFLRFDGQNSIYYIEQIHRYENCKITSLATSGSGGPLIESVTVNFTRACYRSYIFDPDTGEPTGTTTDYCWDLMGGNNNCSCSF